MCTQKLWQVWHKTLLHFEVSWAKKFDIQVTGSPGCETLGPTPATPLGVEGGRTSRGRTGDYYMLSLSLTSFLFVMPVIPRNPSCLLAKINTHALLWSLFSTIKWHGVGCCDENLLLQIDLWAEVVTMKRLGCQFSSFAFSFALTFQVAVAFSFSPCERINMDGWTKEQMKNK